MPLPATRVYGGGHPNLDRDHDILFAILAQLQRADTTAAYLDVALTHLCAYMDAHFEHEELLMTRHGYPDAPAHMKEHTTMRAKAVDLVSRRRAGLLSVDEVVHTIESNVHQHLEAADEKLAWFLNTVAVTPPGPATGKFEPIDSALPV